MGVGSLWDFGFQSGRGRKGFLSGLLLLTFLFLAGLVLLLSKIPQRFYPVSMDYQALGLSIVLYLLVGSCLSFLFFFKEKKWASFMSLMVPFALFHLHLSYSLPPEINSQRSAKPFSETILKRMEVGDDLKTYSLKCNGLIYYTRKPYIESIQNKERFLEIFNSPRRVFVVIYPEALRRLREETGVKLHPIEQVKVGHWDYVLISNH
jgi:hypothetical protein